MRTLRIIVNAKRELSVIIVIMVSAKEYIPGKVYFSVNT